MRGNKKYVIAGGVIVIAFFVYYFSANRIQYVAPESNQTSEKVTDTLAEGVIQTQTIPSTTSVQALSPLEKCAVAEKAKAEKEKIEYSKGTLLVTFNKTISFQDALETLAAYSLGYNSKTQTEADFEKNHWLTVTVPKGQEFKWLCVLSYNTDVLYAGLNEIFSLHR